MRDRRDTSTQVNVSFEREEAGAEKLKAWINELPEGSPERTRLEEIHQYYENMLRDARLLVRMGDRLQAKLRAANEEIAHYNKQLQEKNRELQATLDALQESQRRRKALTVLGISAIVIFMITELIEYYIEQTASEATTQWANFISFGLKALVALAFKPLEELVESLLSHTVPRK